MEQQYDRRAVISELTKSPHGNLSTYTPTATTVAKADPEFYAHLIAWNAKHGEIRDAKIALPVLALASTSSGVAAENASALLADMPPFMLVKALDFARSTPAPSRLLRRLTERYLRDLEADWRDWERTAIQHRNDLRTLYARHHIKPADKCEQTLFKAAPLGGKFAAVRGLAAMSPVEIAAALDRYKLPFLIARGAVGKKAEDPIVAMALIKRMTTTELVTNTKALERLGIKTVPALRAAYEEALTAAGNPKRQRKGATLKATRAAETLKDDALAAKLHALQERQLTNLGTIKGRWAVLVDKSGSMETAIETGRQVAAILARMVENVSLVFFDTTPRYLEASGKTYDELKRMTELMTANGGTCMGCALDYLKQAGKEVDGIALISDGAENSGLAFADAYLAYTKWIDKILPVYWYEVAGDVEKMCHQAAQQQLHRAPTRQEILATHQQVELERSGFLQRNKMAKIQVERFGLTAGVDYYSLPAVVTTMRANSYDLIQEIFDTPLWTLDNVLKRTKGQAVLAGRRHETA